MSIRVSGPQEASGLARDAKSGRCAVRLTLVYNSIATYLGIDVAVKEVLPSNDYDVAKYFEREWRLMK